MRGRAGTYPGHVFPVFPCWSIIAYQLVFDVHNMLHFQVQLVNVDRLFSSRECAMWGANEGGIMVITHKISMDSPNFSITLPSISEQHTILRQLRHELLLQYRPILQQGAGPI